MTRQSLSRHDLYPEAEQPCCPALPACWYFRYRNHSQPGCSWIRENSARVSGDPSECLRIQLRRCSAGEIIRQRKTGGPRSGVHPSSRGLVRRPLLPSDGRLTENRDSKFVGPLSSPLINMWGTFPTCRQTCGARFQRAKSPGKRRVRNVPHFINGLLGRGRLGSGFGSGLDRWGRILVLTFHFDDHLKLRLVRARVADRIPHRRQRPAE